MPRRIALLFIAVSVPRHTVAFSPPPTSRQCTVPSFLETMELVPRSRSTTLFNLGRNYLDTIDDNNEDNNSRKSNSSNRWNFGSKQGTGAAVVRSETNQKNYGIGGGNSWGKQQGRAKIVPIKQPQDLLDFVIEDERLSVVKVYATWCKTCQVFDIRYRKLASQIGDIYSTSSPDALLQKGRVRFSEMAFDDPNNEEMCRLLNATKLPYILVYKGSRGKITDFQCGPSNFQMLIDVVNRYADASVDAVGGDGRGQALVMVEEEDGLEEQEWRVLQEQEQRRLSAGEEESIKLKDEEIARLYKELSNLRKEYDQKIQSIKEEHGYETGQLREEMERQTKQYEEERAALSAQIKQLTQDMIEREKAYRAGEDATSNQLRRDLKDKEREYETTLNGLNYRISSLEEELFKTKNELKYNSEASEREKEEMAATIALLEEEQQNLLSRNKELERELIEDKRLVVQTTEEASRVLKQLEAMRTGKEEEAAKLMARIRELEAEISRLQTDIDGGYDMSREIERLKAEYRQERELMATRIIELESSQGEWQPGGLMELQQERERVLELEQTIESVKAELAQRDRLLRTSNKATDILLDQMEAQKRAYEKELERTAELTNELEEAITKRELELRELQAQFSSLERIAEGLKARDMRRMREEMNDMQGGMENERWKRERELRISAEQEVSQLRELLNQRRIGENVAESASLESKPKKSFFEQMFGARDGGPWDGGLGDGLGFGRSQESMMESTVNFATIQETKGDYDLLNDVLAPDEVSPREGIPGWVGSSKTEYTRNAAEFYTPSPAVVNEVPVRVPTPQLEFERRLAENPIVPAGAFGASRPTAPFFRSSTPPTMDFSSSDRSTSVDQQYRMPSDSSDTNAPTLPPAASFTPRPTSPTPRVRARTGISDNIYAGAGTAATSTTPSRAVPSPAIYDEPAQIPTPQLEFERRLAENPIVPAGAFGGSKPTANFFRKAAAPSLPPRQPDGRNRNEDDPPSKWQSLDEAEKKRVAAEAYKAFEKQLADRRSHEQKPKQDVGGGGGRGQQLIVNPVRSTLQNDSRGGGAGRGPPAENPARTTIQKQKEDQMQSERKKHQEMVEQASRAQKVQQGDVSSSQKLTDKKTPERQEKMQEKKVELRLEEDAGQSQQNQTAQELRRTAAEASTKRAKKAQDASTELKRQNQMKAEAIRREQSERRAREQALLKQRQENEQRQKVNQSKDVPEKINTEQDASGKKLLEEQKYIRISESRANANEEKVLMEQQRRKVAEAKERERELKSQSLARAKAEEENRARIEKQTQQAMKEQLEADARAKAVEEKIQLEEERMKVKAGDPNKSAVTQVNPPTPKSKVTVGSQKLVQRVPQQTASTPLRDLADSGKRLRDLAGSAGNEAKYKVVVLKEGNKSELEGPLKDLLSGSKEAATRKKDNY